MAGGPDEAMLLEVLGEETTRVLTSAREAAAEIRSKAEAAAERIVVRRHARGLRDPGRGGPRRRAPTGGGRRRARRAPRRGPHRARPAQAEAQEAAAVIRAEASEQAQALRDEGQRDLERAREEAEEELDAARASRARRWSPRRRRCASACCATWRCGARRRASRSRSSTPGASGCSRPTTVVRRTIDEATDELSTSLVRRPARRRCRGPPRRGGARADARAARRGDPQRPASSTCRSSTTTTDDAARRGRRARARCRARCPPSRPTQPEPSPVEPTSRPPPVDLGERRGRKRRKKETFEGLPPASSPRWSPQPRTRACGSSPSRAAEPTEAPERRAGRARARGRRAGRAEPDDRADRDGGEPRAEATGRRRAPSRRSTTSSPGCAPSGGPDGEASRRRRGRGRGSRGAGEPPRPRRTTPSPRRRTPFTERDALLDPIDKELGRRLKRALADEQNEVLDLLRRAKPKGVDDLLPTPTTTPARWTEVVADVARRRGRGRRRRGPAARPASVADLADELARSLTAPLRDRIDRSFAAADGNLDDVADRVRALYREWKGQRLTDTSRHYAAAAYARGVFDATRQRRRRCTGWSTPSAGRCPDCDDNVLGGRRREGHRVPHRPHAAPRPTRAAAAWCSRPTADPAPIASPPCEPPTTCPAVRAARPRPGGAAPGWSSAPSSCSS